MERKIEEWDVCPHLKKNFNCKLTNSGIWRLETPKQHGKWIFLIEPINSNTAPTFGDQRNFITGLFEAEWRNDNFVFYNGEPRPPCRAKKINMFIRILDEIKNRADVKGIERGIDYYIKKGQNGKC